MENKLDLRVALKKGAGQNQVKQWRDQLLEAATGIFGDTCKADTEPVVDVKELHAKIGQLTLENDFLSGAPQHPDRLSTHTPYSQ